MNKLHKKLLVPIVIVFVIVLIAGGFFFLNRNNKAKTQQTAQEGFIEEDLPKLTPGDIGLSLVARSDSKAIKFIIAKAAGIDKVEMDFNYDADLPASMIAEGGDESGRIGRGGSDEISLKGKARYESKYYDLGSCSSGTCKYDTGVTEVKVVLKVTKTDGKAYQVEDTLKL
jgi:hypothetical protein